MYCGHCGTKNSDEAVYCIECGAPLKDDIKETKKASKKINPSNKKSKIKIGLIAAVVLVAIAIFAITGRSANEAAYQYYIAMTDMDVDMAWDLIPDDVVKNYEENGEDIAAYKKSLAGSLALNGGFIKNVEGVETSFSYVGAESCSPEKLEEIKEDYKELGIKVSDAATAYFEVGYGVEGTEETLSRDIEIVKIGRSWYWDIVS